MWIVNQEGDRVLNTESISSIVIRSPYDLLGTYAEQVGKPKTEIDALLTGEERTFFNLASFSSEEAAEKGFKTLLRLLSRRDNDSHGHVFTMKTIVHQSEQEAFEESQGGGH